MKTILTKYDGYCVICGKPTQTTHHLIEGTANRRISDNHGLVCPLCNFHHNMSKDSVHLNPAMQAMSHIIGQLAFEKEYYRKNLIDGDDDPAREEFRKLFGKSFL